VLVELRFDAAEEADELVLMDNDIIFSLS